MQYCILPQAQSCHLTACRIGSVAVYLQNIYLFWRQFTYLCHCCSGMSYHCYHAKHRVILDVIFGDFCDLIEDKDLTTTWMLLEVTHNMKLRTKLKLIREKDFQHYMMNYISVVK